MLYDVSAFHQDSASRSQVGDLPAVARIRQDRVILDGRLGRARPWRYLLNADYNGLRPGEKTAFTLNDLTLSIPLGPTAWLALGRQKEFISEEMIASTRILPHAERSAAVLAFIPTRNDGVRVWGTVATSSRGRGGWTIGVFNDFLFNGLSFAAGGEQVSGRVFWAPFVSDDTLHVVQLALNGRWTDAQDGTIQFKSRPEVNEAPTFVNTGKTPASSAALGDASLLVQQGGVSLAAEVLPVHVSGVQPRALTFGGDYAELAWRPRGEPRVYEEETGSLGRVRLGAHRVAVEIGLRYSHVDLTDQTVDGGVFNRSSLGVTVYGPYSLRAQVDYGYATLNKDGGVGRTQLVTARVQWERR